jgi:hypothetical protein
MTRADARARQFPRGASITEHAGVIEVQAVSYDQSGMTTLEEVSTTEATADPKTLGEMVLDALARSREGLPTQIHADRQRKQYLKARGWKSENDYEHMRKLVSVRASLDERSYRVTPTVNSARRNGFEFFDPRTVDATTAHDLGVAVFEAIAASRLLD